MKILHTSDLHIGISLFGEDMLPYQDKIGESLCAAAVECGADCIIIAGDVYDSAVVAGEAVKCWDRLCEKLFSGGRDIPVIIIAGNHDSAPRLSVNSGLLVLGLALLITCQALLHIMVTVNLIPETGQTLPLISRGGSSMLFTMIAFGMILSVSRQNDEQSHDRPKSETLYEK